jgi:hypothetical protein
MSQATRRRSPETEALQRTATALRLVYSSLLPRIASSRDLDSGRLGFAAPSYNRCCVQNAEWFIALAADIGGRWYELMEDCTKSEPNVRRIVREYQDEAALELAAFVGRLPVPIRQVLELKSSGLSWKRVMEALPGRAYFSVMDDWNVALGRVWAERDDLVRRLI